ncbi:hypothetical protein CNMCM8927_009610 [Aspergillus lentulus]|uniref:Uncharacterized protein n=1 Tax=Aspergillus lentulus TaxID=293939 RepID=A0AAN6BJ97_ASPLE|nr:hypothetical protein CNMCM8927_009610 [Aspergillus lentulus]
MPVPRPAEFCSARISSTNRRDLSSSGAVSKFFFCSPGFMIPVYSFQVSPCELMMLSPTSVAITDQGIFFWLPAFA